MIWIIIIIIIILFLILNFASKRRNRISPLEVADIIERFIENKGFQWDWDDFISCPINDPILDKIRIHYSNLPKEYPPDKTGAYTNGKGLEILRQYVEQLRSK